MKLKTSSRLLPFFIIIFLFLIRVDSVSALEDYDPTQKYSVHAVPVLSSESRVTVYEENKSNSGQSEQAFLTSLKTAKDVQHEPSLLNRISISFTEVLKNQWRKLGIIFLVFTGTSTFTFFIMKRVTLSALNSQIRVIGFVSAMLLSLTSGVTIITAYNQQIAFFAEYTGWQFTPIGEDLFIVGGLLLTGLLFLIGPTLLYGAKSLALVAPTLLPKWEKIINYFTKETKSAFTETEKECEDNINDCSSLFDKTVILFFNYLPGNMPDLGMDDAIINFKNSFFKSAQPQRAK